MAFSTPRRNSSQKSFSKQSRAQSRRNEEFADTTTKRQQKPARTTASFRQGTKTRNNNSSETTMRPARSARRTDDSTSSKRTTYKSPRSASSSPRSREDSRSTRGSRDTDRASYKSPRSREDSRSTRVSRDTDRASYKSPRSASSPRSREDSRGMRRSGETEREGNQRPHYGTSPTIDNRKTRSSSPRKNESSTGSTTRERLSSTQNRQDGRRSTDRKPSQSKNQSVSTKRRDEKRPSTASKKTSMSSKVQGTRINKYLADSGVGSRRAVEELITNGEVKVNRKVITDLATRIMPGDFVTVKGEPITDVRRMVYILLNKPKDVITTADDEFGRKTVIDLIKTDKRLFPVGRLDRNTTGVLLLTNDGELAHRLTHPSYEIPRVYNVTLNAPLDHIHAKQIARGVMLDDGEETQPCEIFIDPLDGKKVIMELREGKNREVRRIFEKFGYDVRKLDRKFFATLSTRGLARGKYRVLTRRELSELRELTGLE